jgi:hypothetical protein
MGLTRLPVQWSRLRFLVQTAPNSLAANFVWLSQNGQAASELIKKR